MSNVQPARLLNPHGRSINNTHSYQPPKVNLHMTSKQLSSLRSTMSGSKGLENMDERQ